MCTKHVRPLLLQCHFGTIRCSFLYEAKDEPFGIVGMEKKHMWVTFDFRHNRIISGSLYAISEKKTDLQIGKRCSCKERNKTFGHQAPVSQIKVFTALEK